MKYLFENIEDHYNEIDSIFLQLDFIFNSFCREKQFNGFGCNIWKIEPEEIKKLITREEQRITVYGVEIEGEDLVIYFEYNKEMYEKYLTFDTQLIKEAQ